MIRYVRAASFYALLLVLAAPAVAQDPAAALKQDIETWTQTYSKLWDVTIFSHGGVQVAADGPGFVITVSDVRVAPTDHGYLAVGDVGFRLSPEGVDKYRIADVKFGPRLPYLRAEGGEEGAITIPVERFNGLWSRTFGALLDLDVALKGISLTDGERTLLDIGSTTLAGTSTDKGNGRWDQSSGIRLENLRAGDGGELLTIGGIEIASVNRDADLAAAAALPARLWKALGDWPLLGQTTGEPPPPEMFGMIAEVYRMFSGVDVTYKFADVRFREADGVEPFVLREASIESHADGFDRDSVDSSGVFHLGGLKVIEDVTVSLGALDVRASVKGFKISTYLKLLDQMQRLAAHPEAIPKGSEIADFVRTAFSLLTDGSVELSLADLDVAENGGEFHLGGARAGLEATGLGQAMARLALTVGHNDVRINPPESDRAEFAAFQDFVPQVSNVVIALEDVPIQDLATKAADLANQIVQMPPEQQEMAGLMFLGTLQQALTQANSRLKLDKWHIQSPAAAIDIDGVIQPSAESMMGAVASVKLDVTGFDKIIETAKAMSPPEEQDAIAGFEMIRGASTRETLADGSVVDRYAIEFTPQGQLMVNGKDFSGMAGLMGGGEMPPDETVPPDDGSMPPSDGMGLVPSEGTGTP